jgi:hypothetical protein
MAVLLVTAFLIYRLTAGVNALHIAAIISSITVGLGLKSAIQRKPARGWFLCHSLWRSGSYVGLLAALVAELSTRVAKPYLVAHYEEFKPTVFWSGVAVVSALVLICGGRLIKKSPPAFPSPLRDD